MALTISQILAASYPAVLAESRKAANQWAENAALREFEKQGFIVRKSLGPTIEAPLDYRRNPDSAFLATELQTTSLTKTEVVTAASYTPAELSIPIVWSKRDEATNPSENQKIALVKQLLENGINSHDEMIEQYIFATSTNGFLGLVTHVPTAGTGSDGSIDSGTEAWWQNKQSIYVDDTDIEAAFTSVYNAAAKGTGGMAPSMMVSDGATQALFEGTQQAMQRWVDSQDLKAGFKTLGFKTARYIFSQFGNTKIYFLNPKNFQIVVSKEYFRDRSETQEIQNANGFVTKIYSALQSVTNNRSRLGVAHT